MGSYDPLRERLNESSFEPSPDRRILAPSHAAAARSAAAAAPQAPPASSGSLFLAFLAGAVVALVAALAWAEVVIQTNYEIGFLAWIIGVATGLTVRGVAGGAVGAFERALAGVLSGGAIIVGFYVVFVHAVRADGASVGYVGGRQINFFVQHFGSIVRPIDWLWILLAFVAAFRVSGRAAARRA